MSQRFAGRYQEIRRLGQGGMGEVLLVLDLATGTECALKHLTGEVRPALISALRSEFDVLSRLTHPALVRVRDLGFTAEGTPFLTMDYVPGLAANEALEPQHRPSLFWFAARLARGLEALHRAGIVHGDLKPGNVLVMPAAKPGELPHDLRIVDLGLSVMRGQAHMPFAGTPGYAAPELMAGEAPSVATDLYAFGALLHALLTGSPVIASRATSSLAEAPASARTEVSALENSGAPEALIRLVLQMLSANPAERPADATEVAQELEAMHPAARTPLAERALAETFIGRERELSRISLAAAHDRGRAFLVTGPPGVGRSTLLRQVAFRTASASRVVLVAEAQGAERGGAVVSLLRAIVAALGNSAPRIPAAADAALNGAMHALPEAAEDVLLDALPRWIALLAARRGTPVFVVDDADQLDDASRVWLRRALVRTAGVRVVWVWAMRTLEGAPEATLVAGGNAEHLPLEPFGDYDLARFLAARLGAEPPASLLPWLAQRTGGSPGAIVQSLRAALAAGAILEEAGLLHAEPARLAALPALETGAHAVLAELAPAARDAVSAIAACGGIASRSELAVMLGRDAGHDAGHAASHAVAAAVRAGVVHERAGERWAFTTPAAATQWLERLPHGQRLEWWQRALERRGIDDPERFRLLAAREDFAPALLLAESLYAQSGDLQRLQALCALAERAQDTPAIVRWHARTAETARRVGARQSVIDHADAVLAHSTDPVQRSHMAGLAVRYEMFFHRQERMLERIAAAHTGPVEAVDEAWMLFAHATGGMTSLSDRDELLVRAEAKARECDDAWLRCEVAGAQSMGAGRRGDREKALQLAEESLAQGERSGEWRAQAYALYHLGSAMQHLGRHEEILPRLEAAMRRSRETNDLLAQMHVWRPLHACLMETGRWVDARQLEALARRTALEIGNIRALTHALVVSASMDVRRGHSRAALYAVKRVRRLNAELDAFDAYGCEMALAMIWRERGAHERSERYFTRVLSTGTRDVVDGDMAWPRIEFAKLLMSRERWREAARVLAPAAHMPVQTNADLVVLVLRGRIQIRESDLAGAEDAMRLARAWVLQHPWGYMLAHVDQLAAELSIVRGRPADAITFADAALAAYAALPAPGDHARAAYDLAALAIQHVRSAGLPVADWLEAARERFRKLGDRRMRLAVAELTQQLLRETAPAAAPATEADPDLLEALSGMMLTLSSLDELGRRAVALAVTRLGYEYGVLLLERGDPDVYDEVAEYGEHGPGKKGDSVRYSRTAIAQMRTTGESMYLEDRAAVIGLGAPSATQMRVQAMAVVPLRSGDRIIGCVYMHDSRSENALRVRDRVQLEGFAHLLSAAFVRGVGQQEIEEANARLTDENISLQRALSAQPEYDPADPIIGLDPGIQDVRMRTRQAAMSSTSVLILGPTGTGKELVARELHRLSPRSSRPFVAINCGVGPANLIESEMFGIDRKIATGVAARPGVFEMANGGTLFLDEVGEMPPALQVALLRVLQERVVTRIGSNRPIPLDVRIISATNVDLAREAYEGRFRLDLFFRLAVIPIELPPLRERKGDIPLLAHHLVAKLAARQARPAPKLSRAFIQALVESDWPGNVRELENYIERILAMTPGGELRPVPPPRDLSGYGAQAPSAANTKLPEARLELERRLIHDALRASLGNQSAAAEALGITEQSLRYWLRKNGVAKIRENRRTRRK
jgi:DNA-binding NtrC family response regulator